MITHPWSLPSKARAVLGSLCICFHMLKDKSLGFQLCSVCQKIHTGRCCHTLFMLRAFPRGINCAVIRAILFRWHFKCPSRKWKGSSRPSSYQWARPVDVGGVTPFWASALRGDSGYASQIPEIIAAARQSAGRIAPFQPLWLISKPSSLYRPLEGI